MSYSPNQTAGDTLDTQWGISTRLVSVNPRTSFSGDKLNCWALTKTWKIVENIRRDRYPYLFHPIFQLFQGLQQLHLDEDCTLLMMIWSIFKILFQNDGSIFHLQNECEKKANDHQSWQRIVSFHHIFFCSPRFCWHQSSCPKARFQLSSATQTLSTILTSSLKQVHERKNCN